MATLKIEQALEYVNYQVQCAAERIRLQHEMHKAYMLDWSFENVNSEQNKWVVPVTDPIPHNALRTMANILANRPPRIKVTIPEQAVEVSAFDRTSAAAVAVWRRAPSWIKRLAQPRTPIEKMEETYETVVRHWLRQNDDRRDGNLRRDLALDGFIYDQIALKVIDLRLTKLWRGDLPSLEGQSPFIIKRLDPTGVITERDELGIHCAIHRYVRSVREVKSLYSGRLKGDMKLFDDEKSDLVFTEYWWRQEGKYFLCMWIEESQAAYHDLADQVRRTAWVTDKDGKEIQETGLSFIPIISKTCNGKEDEILPTLYAAVKSGMNVASNVAWTFRASLPILSAMQQYQLEGWVDGQPVPTLDYTAMRVIPVRQNQRLTPLERPSVEQLKDLLNAISEKMQQSTAPLILTGDYPSGAPASAVALTSSLGAQIIEPVREALNFAIAQAIKTQFDYLRAYSAFDQENGGKVVLWMDGGKQEMDGDKLPKWMKVDIDHAPDLPQEKIALMNVAMQAYAMQWLPRDKTYEIAGFEDIHAINKAWEAERQRRGNPTSKIPEAERRGWSPPADGRPAAMSSGVLPPNQAQGYPIDQNPQAPDQMQEMVNALEKGTSNGRTN